MATWGGGRATRVGAAFAIFLALAGSGLALAGEQPVNFAGSAQLDYQTAFRTRDQNTMLPGLNPEVAFKLDADVHPRLSFTGKVCFGCHGFELNQAYLEVTPHELLSAQAGRLSVPFGEFNTRLDPSNHAMASKPLPYEMGHMARYGPSEFNLGVLPVPYVDNAAVVFGTVWPADFLQIYYSAYVASGFKGENDFDFIRQRSEYYTDNNADLARGARLVLTVADAPALPAFVKDVTVGLSAMNGAYDDRARLHYLIYGADASARLGRLTFRGEYVVRKTDIDETLPGYPVAVVDPYFSKIGWYAEAEHPLTQWFEVAYRLDGLERYGAPLPGSSLRERESKILRYSQGFNVKPMDAVKIKFTYEYWRFTEFTDMQVGHVAFVGTF